MQNITIRSHALNQYHYYALTRNVKANCHFNPIQTINSTIDLEHKIKEKIKAFLAIKTSRLTP